MWNGVENLPVVVVSIAGVFRCGKSFLLGYFIRYLEHLEGHRSSEGWMDDATTPLTGFSWRKGRKRITTGIQLWGKIFKIDTPRWGRVAVVLAVAVPPCASSASLSCSACRPERVFHIAKCTERAGDDALEFIVVSQLEPCTIRERKRISADIRNILVNPDENVALSAVCGSDAGGSRSDADRMRMRKQRIGSGLDADIPCAVIFLPEIYWYCAHTACAYTGSPLRASSHLSTPDASSCAGRGTPPPSQRTISCSHHSGVPSSKADEKSEGVAFLCHLIGRQLSFSAALAEVVKEGRHGSFFGSTLLSRLRKNAFTSATRSQRRVGRRQVRSGRDRARPRRERRNSGVANYASTGEVAFHVLQKSLHIAFVERLLKCSTLLCLPS
ncbi:uncharacterized protein LOC135373681 [Ornithodoros turicata]|uniref:uncharacterized protein LOC135373681 n=1 Tax=Ornithodoros turicata TaxID=34597 RepID=UPI0031395429